MRNESLDEILATIDMEYWLDREGIRYRVTRGANGTQLNVRECPCCGNSDYKVYLNAETGLGNCFSGNCEQRFNRWSFIRHSLGALSNRDVVEHIKIVAREQGWQPARMTAAPVNIETELVMPESLPLPIDNRNLRYLENRSITLDIARYFGLRFSMKGVFKYESEDGVPRRQDYAQRIILPIFDLDGNLVSFQGRDITGKAEQKYLFPPGFSSTGAHLYNGQNAKTAEDIVIGEGAFDVMAIKIALDHQPELRHVVPVGSFGKHLSDGGENSQVAKLLRLQELGLKRITLMWDSEPKALEAAADVALKLREYGFITRVAVLPPERDPNEVAPSVVRDAYWRAMPADRMTMTKLKLMYCHR